MTSPSKKRKTAYAEKKQKLKNEMKAMQEKLAKIEEKRRLELGDLLLKHGLGELDDALLETEIEALAKKLCPHENAS